MAGYPRDPCRRRIWDAYREHNGVIASFFSGRRLEQWGDGGFTTMKNEPGDIDIVTYIPTTELLGLDSKVQDGIKAHFRGSRSHPEGLVDSYSVPYEEDGSGSPIPHGMCDKPWRCWTQKRNVRRPVRAA